MGDDVPVRAVDDPGIASRWCKPPLRAADLRTTYTAARAFGSPAAGLAWLARHDRCRLQRLHREGHAIAIVSNESLDRFKSVDVLARHLLKKQTRVSQWCQAIGVPVLALVATAKDRFRKPDVGTWHFVTQLAAESKVAIDLSSSFFVGDAAGRTGDHSDSDRAYAKACALRFYNETEFFGPGY